jgi:hypothetical protein
MTPLRGAWRILGAIASAALVGCASLILEGTAPGTPASDLRARAGSPSEERELPGGVKAWYYVNGPCGWTTYRARFDANDRVLDVAQVLTERNFRTLVANQTTRDQVLQVLGRPGLVSRFPNLGEEVWTYRYRDVTLEMLHDEHFDTATGVLKYYTLYRDPAYVTGGHR